MSRLVDSQGKEINVVSRTIRNSFENRGVSLSGNSTGKTLLSKFGSAGAKRNFGSFTKLAADIETANPAIRSPLLNQSNFYMPESDSSTGEPNRLLNQWIIYYTKWHSLVGNCLSLHAELPLSRFALRGIEDPTILSFYEDMVESAELHLKMIEFLRQYFTFGEVIPHAFWSDTYNCFTDLTFIDPNYVYVKGHYLLHSEDGDDVEFYELEPDPMLINLVKSDDQVTKMLRQYLSEDIIQAVMQNKRLLLSNFSTSMIRHKIKWSDLRGTSIVLRCLKSLLYGDKLREASYAIADGHVNPKWIWKIGQAGDLATGGYMPTEDDLEAFRDLLIEANNDPIFTIITHYAVNVDAVGLNGKLLPLQPEYQQIDKDILTALFTSPALTTGEGPNYASASVAFRAMMSRYIPIRAKVERYLYHKIFAPVAYANKFFDRKQADLDHGVRTGDGETNKLIIPQIDWRSKANLLDDGSIKSIISSMVSSGKMPMKVLCEALDLDYSEVRDYLWREQGTVFDGITTKARDKMVQTVANNNDPTMLGQPFSPKTNQPVSIKYQIGVNAEPHAKSSSKLDQKKRKLLSVKPLVPEITKDPVQTEIDKGKPEKGGNPEPEDPIKKALELKTSKNANKKEESDSNSVPNPKIFSMTSSKNERFLKESVIKKKYEKRSSGQKIVDREAKDKKEGKDA